MRVLMHASRVNSQYFAYCLAFMKLTNTCFLMSRFWLKPQDPPPQNSSARAACPDSKNLPPRFFEIPYSCQSLQLQLVSKSEPSSTFYLLDSNYFHQAFSIATLHISLYNLSQRHANRIDHPCAIYSPRCTGVQPFLFRHTLVVSPLAKRQSFPASTTRVGQPSYELGCTLCLKAYFRSFCWSLSFEAMLTQSLVYSTMGIPVSSSFVTYWSRALTAVGLSYSLDQNYYLLVLVCL